MNYPNGPKGAKFTARLIGYLAKKYAKDPFIYVFARRLTGNLPQKDYIGEVKKVFEYVRDCIRYVRDINELETVQTPDWTLRIGTGDCDDKTTLIAALCLALGHPVKIKIVGNGPQEHYSHVYPMVFVDGHGWIAADATEPEALNFERNQNWSYTTDAMLNSYSSSSGKIPFKRKRGKLAPSTIQVLNELEYLYGYDDGNLGGLFSKIKDKAKKLLKKVEKVAKKVAPAAIAALPIPGATAVAAVAAKALKKDEPKAAAALPAPAQAPVPYAPDYPAVIPYQAAQNPTPQEQFSKGIQLSIEQKFDPQKSPTENFVRSTQEMLGPLVENAILKSGASEKQAAQLAPVIIQAGAEKGMRETVREVKAEGGISPTVIIGGGLGVLALMMAFMNSGGRRR